MVFAWKANCLKYWHTGSNPVPYACEVGSLMVEHQIVALNIRVQFPAFLLYKSLTAIVLIEHMGSNPILRTAYLAKWIRQTSNKRYSIKATCYFYKSLILIKLFFYTSKKKVRLWVK